MRRGAVTASGGASTQIHASGRLVAFALVALSEFVDVRRKAWPKQDLLAAMLHTKRQRIGEWLNEAEALGVLVEGPQPTGRPVLLHVRGIVGCSGSGTMARTLLRSTPRVHLEARLACIRKHASRASQRNRVL